MPAHFFARCREKFGVALGDFPPLGVEINLFGGDRDELVFESAHTARRR